MHHAPPWSRFQGRFSLQTCSTKCGEPQSCFWVLYYVAPGGLVPNLNLKWIREHERKYPPLQAARKGKSLTKKNQKNSRAFDFGRPSHFLELASPWLGCCLEALLEMAEEMVRANEAVMLIGEEAEPCCSEDELLNMIAEWVLTSIEKLFFSHFVDDPQTRRLTTWPYPDSSWILWGSGVHKTQQVCVHTASLHSQTASPKWQSILFQFLATCYVWLWLGVCLKWSWWPVIFLWCLLYSSRQAGSDLVGDAVCFLAKLIADPVLKMWPTRRKLHPNPSRPIEYQRW